MADRDTGFHPLDPDYTKGRAIAIGEANALARAQIAMATRKVTLKPKGESR